MPDPSDSVAAASTLLLALPLRSSEPHAPATSIVAPLAIGEHIGRYIVQDKVGTGGMGEVYRALDPGLGRMVAIKLVHGRAASDEHQQRALVDEAQALARLSHPNVVQVYDAGTHEGRVFVAMEMVEGQTLQKWLHGPRPADAPVHDWRQVIDVFIAAGRGLMAAHAAGIIHGDFKPTNVMIGEDGRARVFDFGLARPVVDLLRVATDPSAESGPSGVIVRGTPAFMAPEQMTGDALTPATDQFAFCVALYHALWRAAPFAGDTLEELQRNVQTGSFRVANDRGLPATLGRIVARGLAVDPAARHPSMAVLIAALGRLRARRRRILYASAMAASGVGLFALLASTSSTPCDAGAQRTAAIWSAERRDAVTTALAAPAKTYAAETARRVGASLDGYVATWNEIHREACETARRGDDATLDATMACLGDALFELDATVTLLAADDGTLTKKAGAMAAQLPDPRRCLEAASAPDTSKPQREPGTQHAALREQVATGRAASRAGHYADAIEIAKRIVDDSSLDPDAWVRVDAIFLLAETYDFNGQRDLALPLYREGIALAASGRYDLAEARGWIHLTRVAASAAEFEEADSALRQAELWIVRLGNDEQLTAELGLNAGVMLVAAGKYAEACARLETTLALTEDVPGSGERHVAVLNNLGVAYGMSGQHDRARDYFARAAEAKSEQYGPDHPDVATCIMNEGVSRFQIGDHIGSRALFEKVIELRIAALGPEHAEVGAAYNSLATAESALGDDNKALEMYRKALAIRSAMLGDDHQGTAVTRNNVAHALMKLGRSGEALPLVEESLAQLQRRLGPGHPLVAYPFHTLAEVRLALGEPAAAISAIESAIAIREAQPGDPHDLALTRFVLARALRAAGREPDRARRLAEQAREVFTVPGRSGTTVAEIDRWLAGDPSK